MDDLRLSRLTSAASADKSFQSLHDVPVISQALCHQQPGFAIHQALPPLLC